MIGTPLFEVSEAMFGSVMTLLGAIATGVSQTVTMLILLFHFILKRGHLRIRRFQPQPALFQKVAMRGLPECIAQFAIPITTLWMNKVLITQVGDIAVNPCKKKHLTAVRSSGADEALILVTPVVFSLEEAIEFITDDELIEVTPKSIRLRKRILNTELRLKAQSKKNKN